MNAIRRDLLVPGPWDFYTFEFRPQPDGRFDIYCVKRPEPGWGASFPNRHIALSGKIVVPAGVESRTCDEAFAIARDWADRYSAYCQTVEFPAGKNVQQGA